MKQDIVVKRLWMLSTLVGLLTAVPLQGQNSTISISCPNQATAASSIPCSVSLSLRVGDTIDALTFGVAVTPNGSAPALTTGQLSFSESISGPFKNTGGTHNAISVLWSGLSPALSGNQGLGSLGFSLPASAASGQSYSVTITGAGASLGSNTVNLSIGSASTVSIVTPGPVLCNTNVAMPPTLRAEGLTELAGEITLTCSGGSGLLVGSALPLINVTVSLGTNVTSRLLPVTDGESNVSETLLILDEPGSGLPGPAGTAPFGPNAPQTICPTPSTGCIEYISTVAGIPVATNTFQGSNATVAGYNVFQGLVNANQVTFFGVPVLSAIDGLTHVYRISNLRANANALGGTSGTPTPMLASISISGSSSIPLNNPTQTIGYVQASLITSATGPSILGQCSSQTRTSVTTVSFGENFASAFKTRVAAQTNTLYAGQTAPGTSANNPPQNIPGVVYGSESGFVIGGTVGGQTAGLADFGTRLKAQFNNVPVGVRLFVSVSNVLNNTMPFPQPGVPGGTATTVFAQLTLSESGAFSAIAATGSAPGTSGSVPVAEIAVVNGTAAAVWEVINTNPAAVENLKFAVYTTYTGNAAQNLPALGTATVNLSYAPVPPSFTPSSGAAASATLPLPRFADTSTARSVLTISVGTCASLSISKAHSGSFAQGQTNATYTVTVSNQAGAGPTSGTVTVTETVPTGVTLVSMAGTGWTCPSGGNTCTRSDALGGGVGYAPVTVTVNVAANASSPQVNQVSVSGGGSASSFATDSTIVNPGTSHPAFFTGEVAISGSVYSLQFSGGNLFGYYAYMGGGWIYHFDLGYEAVAPGNGPEVYMWDLTTGHWWYTNSGTFPYLYDFTLRAWIYYFPDTHNAGHYMTNPRYFVNMTTGQIFTM